MLIEKSMTGFVRQMFKDGKCIHQEFVRGDWTDYQNLETLEFLEYGPELEQLDSPIIIDETK
jgi:hypothetical protein|tara:strand:- start:22 stop:207 length:186 start_codon:yes stop_codon:yes gene_type:complete